MQKIVPLSGYAGSAKKTKTGLCVCQTLFDIVASLAALLVLSPLFLVVSVICALDTKGQAAVCPTAYGP